MIFFFFFIAPATTEIYTLSLHDALPILTRSGRPSTVLPLSSLIAFCASAGDPMVTNANPRGRPVSRSETTRSEEHTSELQSPYDLVCRLLLEKKKTKK